MYRVVVQYCQYAIPKVITNTSIDLTMRVRLQYYGIELINTKKET